MNSVALLIGIDNAGKSTLLSSLQGDMNKEHIPSSGFTSISFELNQGKTTFYDLGGGPSIRKVWEEYYADAHGIIYVIDGSNEKHLTESVNVFQTMIKHPFIRSKPLLIYVNKLDIQGSKTAQDIQKQFIDSLSSLISNPYKIVECIAKPKENNNKIDERLDIGLAWFFNKIEENYEVLDERVTKDCEKKKIIYQQKINEQKKRVQIWKEESELKLMYKEDKIKNNLVEITTNYENDTNNNTENNNKTELKWLEKGKGELRLSFITFNFNSPLPLSNHFFSVFGFVSLVCSVELLFTSFTAFSSCFCVFVSATVISSFSSDLVSSFVFSVFSSLFSYSLGLSSFFSSSFFSSFFSS